MRAPTRAAAVIALGVWATGAWACSGPPPVADAGADAAARDAGQDASPPDAALEDAGTDAGLDAGPPWPRPPYARIGETGGYADVAAGTLAAGAVEYAPRHPRWRDGLEARRWLQLPPGGAIDTSDPDRWDTPLGTRAFLELTFEGRRVETQVMQRVAETGTDADFWFGSFVWDDTQTDAVWAAGPQTDVAGTTHDVTDPTQCAFCHRSEPGRLLGFAAVQLAGATPLSLTETGERGLLSAPVSDAPVPGDAVTAAALGYLHGNCGHCHDERGLARSYTTMILRNPYGAADATETPAYLSTVGVALDRFRSPPLELRVAPGDPDASAVIFRMSTRGDAAQMPPLATELTDETGIGTIRAWIASLMP